MSRPLENLVLGLYFSAVYNSFSVSSASLPSALAGPNFLDCRSGACRFTHTWLTFEDLGSIPGTQVEAYNDYNYIQLSATGLWNTCAPQIPFNLTADFFESCVNQTWDMQAVCNFDGKNFFTPAGSLDQTFLSAAYKSLGNASAMIQECLAWDGSSGLSSSNYIYNYYDYYGDYTYEQYGSGSGNSGAAQNKGHHKGKREDVAAAADHTDDSSNSAEEEDASSEEVTEATSSAGLPSVNISENVLQRIVNRQKRNANGNGQTSQTATPTNGGRHPNGRRKRRTTAASGSNTNDNEAKGQKKAGGHGKKSAKGGHKRRGGAKKLTGTRKSQPGGAQANKKKAKKALKQLGLNAMPSQADIMRAYCVEASVEVALEACGEDLIKQHGLPPPNGPAPSG